jgi:uncharacterized repeat protein (TIGR03803 family)
MSRTYFARMACILTVFCVATVASSAAQDLTTLVNFNEINGSEPSPSSPLVQGTDGNFYGVAQEGGARNNCFYTINIGCGTVFRVDPNNENFTTLYTFCSQSNCSDGGTPVSLIQAANGNFYGVTSFGGVPNLCNGWGCGTIFEITPAGKLTTLYTFCMQSGCPDGTQPVGLVQGTNGNFYGVTTSGSPNPSTVFELSAAGRFTILHTFCAETGCADGTFPVANLVQASNKELDGSTESGGAYNAGTLFAITPSGKLTTLFNFPVPKQLFSWEPNTMIQGADGNLYGTTAAGGIENNGVVFKMTPEGKVTLLHNFCSPNCKNGDVPTSGLVQGSDGNFYGDTFGGGILPYAGSTYQITPTGAFTAFHLFCSDSCLDGSEAGALMQATDGNFYGTTLSGGAGGDGTVFRLSTGLGPFVAARPGFGSAGQAVTILGNGLSGTTSVTFNGLAATFKAESDTFIRATVPSGATSGPIVVTTPSGTLNSNMAFEISR